MSVKLLDILKNSSLSSLISAQEIVDIAEELKEEIEEYMEAQLAEKDDRIEELEEENLDLEDEILRKEKKIDELEYDKEVLSVGITRNSLQDQLIREWVEESWETLREMYLSGEKLDNRILKSRRDADTFVSALENPVDKAILLQLLALGDHKRLILVGKAASGKDYARKLLEEKGFKYAVSYTTRPPRAGEAEGRDYFFKSEEEFQVMAEEQEFYEHVSFNGWHYGTTVKQFYRDDVFIMTPYGISKLKEDDRKKSLIIYFDIEENVRRERLSQRSDADTVERRIEADARDFENFTDFDIRITNHNF